MKAFSIIFLFMITSCTTNASEFQNLDFEVVNTNSCTIYTEEPSCTVWGYGPTSNLIPGWKLYYGTSETMFVGYNDYKVPLSTNSIGNAGVLSRAAYGCYLGTDVARIRGDHVLYFWYYDVLEATYTLTQRGDIPKNVVRIDLEPLSFNTISINNILIDPTTRDISAFAGQQDVLLSITFANPQRYFNLAGPFNYIDRISFTNIIIKPTTPQLSIYYDEAKELQLNVKVEPSLKYLIETKTDLWQEWSSYLMTNSLSNSVTIPVPQEDRLTNRFFRAKQVQ